MSFSNVELAKPLNWAPLPIESNASGAELAHMLRRIEAYWKHLDIPETLYHTQDLASDFNEKERDFYSTGRELIDIFQRTAERCEIALDRCKICLELGCGVGRLTVWLSEVFQRVIGVDISRLRLQMNQRALRQFHRTNVEHHQLITVDSISTLPDFDVFFSIIVLQHNPPPIIAALLGIVLGKLRPGGIAYFQVPTFIKDYTFSIEDYLREKADQRMMEMHAIPQKRLFDIFATNGCELLEIREDPWTFAGDAALSTNIISNSILVKKTSWSTPTKPAGLDQTFA
jgi:SAM-dependent methyltransferase